MWEKRTNIDHALWKIYDPADVLVSPNLKSWTERGMKMNNAAASNLLTMTCSTLSYYHLVKQLNI